MTIIRIDVSADKILSLGKEMYYEFWKNKAYTTDNSVQHYP